MRALTTIAVEIYQNLKEQYNSPFERAEATRQYILNEITHWEVKTSEQGDNYFFKPKEFIGDKNSPPFEVRLLKSKALEGYHELKFGNLNASTDEERYKWDDKDPYRLQKALFLMKVLESKIKYLFETGKITGYYVSTI